MNDQNAMDRRRFLRNSAGASAGLLAAPTAPPPRSTTRATYLAALAIAHAVPERFQELVARAS